jgi:hypothetical protein
MLSGKSTFRVPPSTWAAIVLNELQIGSQHSVTSGKRGGKKTKRRDMVKNVLTSATDSQPI